MPGATEAEATKILAELANGDGSAVERLMPIVYEELRGVAVRSLRQERPDHTLQATALVHEAYLRLINQNRVKWQNRAHFFAVAAQIIRRILVDHARAHGREKRGGGWERITLTSAVDSWTNQGQELLALDEALNGLAALSPRQARVVELRFFGELSSEETSLVLDVSEKTVRNDWRAAKAWLRWQLEPGSS